MELFNYIVEQPDTDLECVNNDGDTALLLAAASEDCKMAHKLIQKGADINAVGNYGNTPLHSATENSNFEMVAMLLYYGADANVADETGGTPFVLAIETSYDHKIQELLIEYETDFNRILDGSTENTLLSAIIYASPLTREIVRRGANVGYDEMIAAYEVSFDEETLKILWHRYISCIKDDGANDSYTLLESLYASQYLYFIDSRALEYFSMVFYSPHAAEIVQSYDNHRGELLSYLIWRCDHNGVSATDLHSFICICLSWGANVLFCDAIELYECYGFNETLKLLLHVGVEMDESFNSTIPRLICDINKDANEIFSLYKENFELLEIKNYYNILEFFASPLKYAYKVCDNICSNSHFTQDYIAIVMKRLVSNYHIPSLKELSREMSRKAIRTQFHTLNTSQFYSVLNYLSVPEIIKKIIAYEVPLYEKIEPSDEEKKILD